MPFGYTQAGVAAGIDKGVANFVNLLQAKEKLRQDKELLGIKKKKGELDIKEAEFNTDPEIINLRREKFKADAKQSELDLKAKGLTIKKAEEEIMDEIRLGVMAETTRLQDVSRERAGRIAGPTGVQLPETEQGWTDFDSPAFAQAMRESAGLTKAQAFKAKVGVKTEKEKRDYLLKIPPKELAAKKKNFWSQFGNTMLSNLTGGAAGDITEANRGTTIEEVRRKFEAGEELSPDEAILLVMNSIKTTQDIEELLENRESYEAAGVDVQYILDFFTAEEEK